MTSTKHRMLFLLPRSPRWDLSNYRSVVWDAVFFRSLLPWGLLSSPQNLGFFTKDAQTDSPTCCWLKCVGTQGIIKFSSWSTALQHKVPPERAFKVGWMGGGGLTKANVFSRFLLLIIKKWPLRIKDGIILIKIIITNGSNLKLS